MAVQTLSKEQLNYFKFADIVINEFPVALRRRFECMWDTNFGLSWDDSQKVRDVFLDEEDGFSILPTDLSYHQWDFTILFQVLLHSRSLSDDISRDTSLSDKYVEPARQLLDGTFHRLSGKNIGDKKCALAVDQLRLLRNCLRILSPNTEIATETFEEYIPLVEEAFSVLNVATTTLKAKVQENDFPAERVRKLKEDITNEFQAESEESILESINALKKVLQRELEKVAKRHSQEMGEKAKETATETEKTASERELLKLNDLLLEMLNSGDQPLPSVPELPQKIFNLTDNQREWLLSNLALETFVLPRIHEFLVERINTRSDYLPRNVDELSVDKLFYHFAKTHHLTRYPGWSNGIRRSAESFVIKNLPGFRQKVGTPFSPLRHDVKMVLCSVGVPWKDVEELLQGIDNFRARGLDLLVKVSGKAASLKKIQQLRDEVKKSFSEVQASPKKFIKVSETEKAVCQQDVQPERELTKGTSNEIEEAEKLVGQQDIQPDSELTKTGASMEDEVSGAEELSLVGRQDIQPGSEPTKGASEESEEAQQERYHGIKEKTKEFEALRKECIRVLPYKEESGQVCVQLYVFCGNEDMLKELRAAAQEFFKEMGVKPELTDLYQKESEVPNTNSGMSKILQKDTAEKINNIINDSLLTFSQHRNITAVYPSLKIIKSEQTDEPCIMINVVGKGRIPIDESTIPKKFGDYRVDIIEGFWIETKNPSNPNELHEEMDHLRLGASIGNEEGDSGTLGAILSDVNGDNQRKFYLLSCNHAIGFHKSEIIHPGRRHYLELLKHYLAKYKTHLKRIAESNTNLTLSGEKPPELELLKEFRQLQNDSDKVNYSKLPRSEKFSGEYEDFIKCAQKLEELFKHPPRVVADFLVGFTGNVNVSQFEYGIDAAVAELREEEVKALRGNLVKMIGTTDYPSGSVMISSGLLRDVRNWCKSGSVTGYTSTNSYFHHVRLMLKESPIEETVCDFDPDKKEVSERREFVRGRWCLGLKKCLTERQLFSDTGDSGAVVFEKCEGEESMSGIGIIVGGHFVNHSSGFELMNTLVAPLDVSLGMLSLARRKNFLLANRV